MTDQLYCPTCGPDWQGAYDMNHRCVKCGDPLRAEKVMEKLKAVEEERDALAAKVEDWRKGIALAKSWHWERDERGYHGCQKEADAFLDWLADRDQNDTPATSLARLKAEALEEWGERRLGWARYDMRTIGAQELRSQILEDAAELRRQAEGEP